MTMSTITVKIEKELKNRMKEVGTAWTECIREAIRLKIESEERKKAAGRLLQDLKAGKHIVPKGFINRSLREQRNA
ncbi:MAG: hypothetical protein QXE79_05815 [Candidatus Bathyarchaeia archaeon]